MQVRLSNVSKLVPRETLFALFSILGDVLMLEPVTSNDLCEWNCVFANISDAQRALELSRTELGDSIFYVEPASSLLLPQPSRTQGNTKCRTAVLFPRINFPVDEESLRSFFLAVEVIQEASNGSGAVLIEFSDRPEMLRACSVKDERYELFDASCCFKLPVVAKEPMLYGVPASKLLSVRSSYNAIPATPLPTTSKTTLTNTISNNTFTNATPFINRNRSPPPLSDRKRSPSPSRSTRRHHRDRSPSPHRRHYRSRSPPSSRHPSNNTGGSRGRDRNEQEYKRSSSHRYNR